MALNDQIEDHAILITGFTGLLGTRLAEALLKQRPH
jgi:nucleoside-diphosphate-sugar epimerase